MWIRYYYPRRAGGYQVHTGSLVSRRRGPSFVPVPLGRFLHLWESCVHVRAFSTGNRRNGLQRDNPRQNQSEMSSPETFAVEKVPASTGLIDS
jgi:hypothetical protein